MSYAIEYGPGVEKDMLRLPRAVVARVDKAILALADEPRPHGCKKLAAHKNLYRVRVGDWRIVYEINDDHRIIIVMIVGHRRDVYRGL